jgi:amino acid transporter, AAT family
MLAWWVALAAHVRFRSRLSTEEIARLPLRSPGGAWGSALGFAVLALAIATTWWVPESRITIVSGGPYLLVLTATYWFARRTRKGVRAGTTRA